MPVYLIRCGEAGPVKIGYTGNNSNQRLEYLQTGHHEKLSLIRSLEGGRSLERALHERFKDHRLNREWFTFQDEMLTENFIDPEIISEQQDNIDEEPMSDDEEIKQDNVEIFRKLRLSEEESYLILNLLVYRMLPQKAKDILMFAVKHAPNQVITTEFRNIFNAAGGDIRLVTPKDLFSPLIGAPA